MRLITKIMFILCLTISPWSMAQNVYSWVDDNGVLHFSDSPGGSNAVALTVDNFGTEVVPQPPANVPSKAGTSKAEKPTPKKEIPFKINLLSPEHNETIRSNNGNISIKVELTRPLQIGESLQLMLDGKAYGAPSTLTEWNLKNIDRGAHTFAVQAVERGKVLTTSRFVTVHLQRASVKK